jgi:hypothetical protein
MIKNLHFHGNKKFNQINNQFNVYILDFNLINTKLLYEII